MFPRTSSLSTSCSPVSKPFVADSPCPIKIMRTVSPGKADAQACVNQIVISSRCRFLRYRVSLGLVPQKPPSVVGVGSHEYWTSLFNRNVGIYTGHPAL